MYSSQLDHNFVVLRREFRDVVDGIRQLEKKAESIARQCTDHIEGSIEQHVVGEVTARIAANARAEDEYRLEIQRLERQRALGQERLETLEEELQAADMHAQILGQQLDDARRVGTETTVEILVEKREVGVGDTEEVIRAAFQSLRESVADFARSSAVQLGQLPATLTAADILFSPPTWNSGSRQQRQLWVVAKVFHLLFRRILRPGLRIFGLQAFLRSDEHGSISASEAHLRALEKELEAQGVDSTTLHRWIATTIETTSPLRDISAHVEGITQEIFDALQPVLRLVYSRNQDKVKQHISAICEEAVRLKLAMRQAPGSFKIELPSRDAKRWGEPGCDELTRVLRPDTWLSVVDREVVPDDTDEMDRDRAAPRRAGGDIACVSFGALTRVREGDSGEVEKVVLEKGWVIAKGGGGIQKLKRTASPAAKEEQPQPKKTRVSPNAGITPAHLRRVKALMGGD